MNLSLLSKTYILIPLSLDKVQLAVIPKGSPLRVDDHVVLLREVALVQRLDVLHVLQVARVGPCSKDQTDTTPVILPCAAHEAAGGVVEDGTDVNLDVPPLVEGLVQQGNHILAFDSLAVESLCPPDQAGLCQALLPGFRILMGTVVGNKELTCKGRKM